MRTLLIITIIIFFIWTGIEIVQKKLDPKIIIPENHSTTSREYVDCLATVGSPYFPERKCDSFNY